MADKRCYNKSESIHYFGINRHAFETYIEPQLEGKGIAIGSCLVYEVRDLDMAWDAYKAKAKIAASAPPGLPQTRAKVSAKKIGRPTRPPKEAMTSSELGSVTWNAAVAKVLEKGKPRKK